MDHLLFSYYYYLTVAFIFGSVLGSFLNVCIYRIPRDENIVFPPSRCTSCNAKIKPYHNIPVFSYIWLRGRCAECKSPISSRYFFVELFTGIFTAYVFYLNDLQLNSLFWHAMIFWGILLVTFFIDLDFQVIFSELLYYGSLAGLIMSFFMPVAFYHSFINDISFMRNLPGPLLNAVNALCAGIGGYLFFYIIRWIFSLIYKQEAMGLGDVELAFFMGIFLGLIKSFTAFVLSFFAGGIIAIVLLSLKKKERMDAVAFGTFMAIGGILSLLYSSDIITWYFSIGNFFSNT
jgi:leader peptidase (prepilin peptidase)/N-methyltransferase